MFRNIAEYNEKYYMESERAYISTLNQHMVDDDRAFCESWVKSMGNLPGLAGADIPSAYKFRFAGCTRNIFGRSFFCSEEIP